MDTGISTKAQPPLIDRKDRRKTPFRLRRYQIKTLQDKHKEILRRLMLGQKGTDIARSIGVSPVTVNYVKNSALGAEALDNMQAARDYDTIDIAKKIKETAPLALRVLTDLMTDEETPETVRAKAALGVLDRAGFSVVHKVQSENIHGFLSKEDIEDIKKRSAEALSRRNGNGGRDASNEM